MYSVTYYKLGRSWYLDQPDFIDRGGDPELLERIGTFHDFLELASNGASMVVFDMDTKPFDGADVFELIASSGGNTGGYYRLNCFEGRSLEMELWFNNIIYTGQQILPERIYVKRSAVK